MSTQAEDRVLDFWFGPIDEEGGVQPEKRARWWKKDADFDALCRSEFEADLAAAKAGEREDWKTSPRGCLAFIILCDQLSRNMYRDAPGAFESDPLALAATQELIERGGIDELSPVEKSFAYMPLMHSEDPQVQLKSIERFTALATEGQDNLSFAESHKAIIDRFGRYPHRNAILGRASTAEELEFLEQPGSSF